MPLYNHKVRYNSRAYYNQPFERHDERFSDSVQTSETIIVGKPQTVTDNITASEIINVGKPKQITDTIHLDDAFKKDRLIPYIDRIKATDAFTVIKPPQKEITVLHADRTLAAKITPADNINEAWVDRRINGDSSLSFTLPLSSGKWADIDDPENILVVDGHEYTMLDDDSVSIERTDDNKLMIRVSAPEMQYLLRTKYPTAYNSTTGYDHIDTHMVVVLSAGNLGLTVNGQSVSITRFDKGSAGYALEAILYGTGWSVGEVDVDGVHDLETDKYSVLENVNEIQKLWGGLLIWDSAAKTVSLRDEVKFQPYSSFQIRYGKNMKNIAKNRSSAICTRLYPYGENNLNIASVNDGKEYIENFSYTTKVYEKILPNNDIKDAKELKEWAEKELAKICKPQEKYTTSILDLRQLPEHQHETFAVGDMADIIDEDVVGKNIIRKRIIYHRYNVFQPHLSSFELGDETETLEDLFAKTFSAAKVIENNFSSNYKMSGSRIIPGTAPAAPASSVNEGTNTDANGFLVGAGGTVQARNDVLTANDISTTFTTNDGKTITVVNGQIVKIE